MKRRRNAIAIMLIASMLVGCGTRQAAAQEAQEAPPDLKMLMNLDLFESHQAGATGTPAPDASAPAQPGDDSMLDQIRALDAMGYLGKHPGQSGNGTPKAAESAPAPEAEAPAPAPAGQPSYDVEGPQP
jgi:hypothetical protein